MSCVAAGGWRGSRGQERNRFHCWNDTDTNVAVIIDILPSLILAYRHEECKIHWSQRVGENVLSDTIWFRYWVFSKTQLMRRRLLRELCFEDLWDVLPFWGGDSPSDKNNHRHPCCYRPQWDVKLCLHRFCTIEQQEVREAVSGSVKVKCPVWCSTFEKMSVVFKGWRCLATRLQCYFIKATTGPLRETKTPVSTHLTE